MTRTVTEWKALATRLQAAGEVRSAERLRQALATVQVYQPGVTGPVELSVPAGVESAIERLEIEVRNTNVVAG